MKPVFLLFFLSICYIGHAQPEEQYKNLPGPTLQKLNLITDKVIYTPNEQIWFSAYVFDQNTPSKDTADILSLALYDPITEGIVCIKKFLIHHFVSNGNILLPDSLKAGNYIIIAYTNLVNEVNQPVGVAYKPIKIYNKTGEKSFTTSLTVVDSLSDKNRVVILHKIIPSSYQAFFKDALIRYAVGAGKPQKMALNSSGEGLVYIDRKYIEAKGPAFFCRTIYNNDTAENRIKIPRFDTTEKKLVNFYPESGVLTAGFTNRVFWEITDHSSITGQSMLLLLDNDKIIDSINISAAAFGSFSFVPVTGNRYAVRLLTGNNNPKVYNLPPIADNGIKIQLPGLVVNDTLVLNILSGEKKNVKLVIVDANETPWSYNITVNQNMRVVVALNPFPRGLNKLFISDDKKNMLAKTYFFAHHNLASHLNISTERETYKPRDSIVVRMTMQGPDAAPLNAIASVSGTLISRLDFSMLKNLNTDFYLNSMAYNEPAYFKRQSILKDASLLEAIIRMKNLADNLFLNDSTASVKVTLHKPRTAIQAARFGKEVKKPLEFLFIRDNDFLSVITDGNGKTALPPDALLVNDGRRIFAKAVGTKNADIYALTSDSLITVAGTIAVPEYKPAIREVRFDPQLLLQTDQNEKFTKVLETVVVKSKPDMGGMGKANACGDYVCPYNILNCPNHPVPYKWPVKGAAYNMPGGGKIVYNGCQYADNLHLPAQSLVYLPRPFLGMDSSLLKQDFPEYMTTICWKPFYQLFANKENKIVFNASDQKGTYLIVVQGFTERGDPFYAEKAIKVEE